MEEKLTRIEKKYTEIENKLADPEVSTNPALIQKYSKELSDLKEIVENFRIYKTVSQQIKDAKEMLKDPEMKELAESELKGLEDEKSKLDAKLEFLMIPKDPNDEKSIFLEIRAGTGGDEAALFAGDLFRMYTRYAERNGFKTEVMSANSTGLGGFKEVVLGVYGKGAFSKLKFEGGTHRVQRVPDTETGGRIHTSAATVAVMPEAEDIDIKVETKDLRVDTYRASGPGGQSVNKTSSAVRITHVPSGIVVACQDERSQHQNRDKAMKLLKAKIFEAQEEKQRKEREELRRVMVGSGDRSEKIRTYNFPQSRVTDHRIGFTTHNLQGLLDGDINDLIEALIAADRVVRLEKMK
ncbi:MAG: peptide chain release factor 1 [Candidatus Margulisbacteria bacterium]|nr:peptide chain release factor 1 [Candidatus Margulisiibacteriota bacterium]MBU1022217.1 peptide chain release factor 1 [Candidatus Margulisiibacteriota bacterium]MBU1729344.1 peptide chain release factor 1 [Candidatus Margulisiibacteriota bacterium]MBU1955617.1 peptide chain release factor 1 [Candidatus Margulisiibacteriota bacterium]